MSPESPPHPAMPPGTAPPDPATEAPWPRHREPRHIAAYRGFADARGAVLTGRVLANAPAGSPEEHHTWRHNLRNTLRRFHSHELAGVDVEVQLGTRVARVRTDRDGYYRAELPPGPPAPGLWTDAIARLADGRLATAQPVLQVPATAGVGIISDIDDTVLDSSITRWKTALQLVFLHNARTRTPLLGVAPLYAALQAGADGQARNPLFYVSSSPWNLYDLLDDFLHLNRIPPGPMFLRDLGLGPGRVGGHAHKRDRLRALVTRLPHLRWVLLGDSGQADASLYAEAARDFGDRILAVYIRDVDPGLDTPRDRGVDAWIGRVAGTRVPMLRVGDSLAIAEHAAGLGLLPESALPDIAAAVRRDAGRPTLGEAALAGAARSAPG